MSKKIGEKPKLATTQTELRSVRLPVAAGRSQETSATCRRSGYEHGDLGSEDRTGSPLPST